MCYFNFLFYVKIIDTFYFYRWQGFDFIKTLCNLEQMKPLKNEVLFITNDLAITCIITDNIAVNRLSTLRITNEYTKWSITN